MLKTAILAAIWAAAVIGGAPLPAAEADALAISARIQARHLPFGTILDPIFASPTSEQIAGYTRCGDSAIWTGHYLAAEAFRYQVTRAPEALDNVRSAIAGIQSLVDVTRTDVLARCRVPLNSPFAAGIKSEEAHNGIYTNSSAGSFWVGNTSRDQYSGVIFGLSVAYDMVDDSAVQNSIRQLVTRLLDFLIAHNWVVVMPDFSVSTVFLNRADQILSFLWAARHVNPEHFEAVSDEQNLLLSAAVLLPIAFDVASDDSYFKFNLDAINLYNLIRLDTGSNPTYRQSYDLLRSHTAGHQNAFFNMIDRGFNGPNQARDDETMALLAAWLQKPRRDFSVDVHGIVPVCGDQACRPIAVPLRPPTDFLWQRNPFQLAGGGKGVIESAGIDYVLPYWMARYYSVAPQVAVQSAAAAVATVAPGSIASLYGPNLTGGGSTNLTVRDAAGRARTASLLYVSPHQINFIVPQGTALGLATFTVHAGSGSISTVGTVLPVAPTLFSADQSGTGVAAATATVRGIAVTVFACDAAICHAVPLDLSPDAPLTLTLYGTGIRNRSALANVTVTINGASVPVSYAGPQSDMAGTDQVRVTLPLTLRGSGEINIVLTVDRQTANTVTVNVR